MESAFHSNLESEAGLQVQGPYPDGLAYFAASSSAATGGPFPFVQAATPPHAMLSGWGWYVFGLCELLCQPDTFNCPAPAHPTYLILICAMSLHPFHINKTSPLFPSWVPVHFRARVRGAGVFLVAAVPCWDFNDILTVKILSLFENFPSIPKTLKLYHNLQIVKASCCFFLPTTDCGDEWVMKFAQTFGYVYTYTLLGSCWCVVASWLTAKEPWELQFPAKKGLAKEFLLLPNYSSPGN